MASSLEDADEFGPSLVIVIESLDPIGRVRLGAVLSRRAHVGKHISLGFIHEDGGLGQFGAELIGDLAPLRPGRFGIVPGEGGGDEGADAGTTRLSGVLARDFEQG
jgi:hypothetical protein